MVCIIIYFQSLVLFFVIIFFGGNNFILMVRIKIKIKYVCAGLVEVRYRFGSTKAVQRRRSADLDAVSLNDDN